MSEVTILVVPRDRFSSVVACVRSIVDNTAEAFDLIVADFGYSKKTRGEVVATCGDVPVEFLDMGRTIPMEALRRVLPRIETKYVAWVDNDTYVTPGWMTAAMDRMAAGARVVLPVTLECEGLDVDPRKAPYRNHISHAELRRVEIDGKEYVFDYKPYRRALPEELPDEPHTVDFFEFHAVIVETEVLRAIDIPEIVMREHVDIGLQLHRMGVPIWCEPKSVVHFDNIRARPTRADLSFFFYRWGRGLVEDAHRVFEERWGYRFLNEQFIKNWAFRRKVYSVARYLFLPQKAADFTSRAMAKLFCKKIPPELLEDPLPRSERVMAPIEDHALSEC